MASERVRLNDVEIQLVEMNIRSLATGEPCTPEYVADFTRTYIKEQVTAMAAEIRERRAADLTADEFEALRWLRGQAHAIGYDRAKRGIEDLHTGRALAVLDRLIKSDAKAGGK